jgi:Subtilase family
MRTVWKLMVLCALHGSSWGMPGAVHAMPCLSPQPVVNCLCARPGEGVSGVMPVVSVMAIKVIGPQGGAWSNIARGMDYALMMGAHITSNSFGSAALDPTILPVLTAAQQAGERTPCH